MRRGIMDELGRAARRRGCGEGPARLVLRSATREACSVARRDAAREAALAGAVAEPDRERALAALLLAARLAQGGPAFFNVADPAHPRSPTGPRPGRVVVEVMADTECYAYAICEFLPFRYCGMSYDIAQGLLLRSEPWQWPWAPAGTIHFGDTLRSPSDARAQP
jgi:hypothetical protein